MVKKLSPIELFIKGYHAQFENELRGELNRLKRLIKKWADQAEGYSHDSVKANYRRVLAILLDVINKGLETIRSLLIKALRKRTQREREIMIHTTHDLLRRFLEQNRGIQRKAYDELRRLIIDLFKDLFGDELERFLDEQKLDIENLFPRQSATTNQSKHAAACVAFDAAIRASLMAAGLVPCNGYNHGLCFCGWGGTKVTA